MIRQTIVLGLVLAACSKSKRGGDHDAPVKPAPVPIAVIDAAPPDAAPTHTKMASMSRGMCLGPCPVYLVTVFEDGSLEYIGDSSVKLMGKHEGHITLAEVKELRAAFAKADFKNLHDFLNVDRTDAPSADVMLDGKMVRHYHGDMKAPPELNGLESDFDRIVHIEQFIGTQEERMKLNR